MSETVTLGVFIFVSFLVLTIILVINERNRREDQHEFKALMERIDGNTARIADHTRHIANLVVQNGTALARVETITQQILTRLADERSAH
jgi:hypothetical protein